MLHDYRYDPFTDTSEAIIITDETHIIPSSTPYVVRLSEVPMKETPSSISLKINGVDADEVSAAPAAGEFWPDYSTGADNDPSWNTGTLLFNEADAGKEITVTYKGTGRLVDTAVFLAPVTFTASGEWTCPDGIKEVLITICGGGGGGGATNGDLVPTINGNSGGKGGTSSFGSLLSASGGWGGGGSSSEQNGSYGNAGGVGGTAATASASGGTLLGDGRPVRTTNGTGQTGVNPGTGGTGGRYGHIAGSGGGAATYVRKAKAVSAGEVYAITIGAGGTGGAQNSNGGYGGGVGAPGICIIEYV